MKFFNTSSTAISTLLGLAIAAPAFGQAITIQGRITDAQNRPVDGKATEFRVQILTPDSQMCVLFDESSVLDLSETNGFFTVNLNNGKGRQNAPATYTLKQAVSNREVFSIDSRYCASGSGTHVYNPQTTDSRKVVIRFRDPATMASFETLPAMEMNPVPYAMNAQMLDGIPSNAFLRVENAGAPGVATALNSSELSELVSLARGTSSRYLDAAATIASGIPVPALNAAPSSPSTGGLWFDNGAKELKYFDGTSVKSVAPAAPTVTSLSVGGDLTGTTAGAEVTALRGHAVATAAPAAGQFLKYDGTAYTPASIGLTDLRSSFGGALFAAAGCSAAQALYWDSASDEIKCQSIGGLDASAITSGTIPNSRLPASFNVWDANGSSDKIHYTGNVGVGTTDPQFPLHVEKNQNANTWIFIKNPNSGATATSGLSAIADVAQVGLAAYSSGATPWHFVRPNGGSLGTSTSATGGLAIVAKNAAAPITFHSGGNAERMRLDAAGNLGIGVTPAYKLDVAGDLRISGIPYRASGDIAWQVTSDARLKDVTGTFARGLAELEKLDTIRFRYKAGNPLGADPSKEYSGVIAQQVEAVMPEAVARDSKGYLSLNTTPIFWALVNASKQIKGALDNIRAELSEKSRREAALNEKVAQLEAKNADLQNRLERIEARLSVQK